MMFNSFVKIDEDIIGTGADNYAGKIGRIIGVYPSDFGFESNLYKIYFEDMSIKNFFDWQFSIVNLSEQSIV